MRTGTVVQLPRPRNPAILWVPVRNTLDIVAKHEGDGVAPYTIDVGADLATFLERYAAYENAMQEYRHALARHLGQKTKPGIRWTRKSLSEVFLKAQIEDLQERLADQIKALGELPAPDDEEALEKYAKRAHEWLSKKSNRG